jgi:hypothetical protein
VLLAAEASPCGTGKNWAFVDVWGAGTGPIATRGAGTAFNAATAPGHVPGHDPGLDPRHGPGHGHRHEPLQGIDEQRLVRETRVPLAALGYSMTSSFGTSAATAG